MATTKYSDSEKGMVITRMLFYIYCASPYNSAQLAFTKHQIPHAVHSTVYLRAMYTEYFPRVLYW